MKSKTAKKILQSVQDSYNLIAQEFSDTRNHSWAEFKYFKNYLNTDAEILDIGCGNGRLLTFLYEHYLNNNFHYIGIDNSEALLHKAKEKHSEALFIQGDQIDIPIADSHEDLIFNIAAFHHIPGQKLQLEALAEMKRVLKPNGILIMTVWNLWQKKYLFSILKASLKCLFSLGNYHFNDLFIPWKGSNGKSKIMRYYHAFLPVELFKLAKKSGFEIVESFSVKEDQKVVFSKGRNFCLILKKITNG